jgi:signal transduction histidine kinase
MSISTPEPIAPSAREEQALQAQKMEAVGRLAGGIAHDFNNLLTAILSYAELIRSDLPPADRHVGDLDEIIRAAKQAHGLTRQLLDYSRAQAPQPVAVELNAVVVEVERMLRRLIGEDIALVTDLDPGVRRIKADRGQIQQVIMNLAVNARDAMPAGGTIAIRTANVDHTEEADGGPQGTGYVLLTMSDTGVGMDAETRRRIFEPFFTTKDGGTGLGLATVHTIVGQSGGFVRVASTPGAGSTFSIYLPRLEA